MNKYEREIILAAKAWWKSLRPLRFNKAAHIKNPMINCRTSIEDRLARAVAKHATKVRSYRDSSCSCHS